MQYDIDPREYWRILKKRKLVVIAVAIALGLFSTAYAILKAPTPLYTSVCSIKFERGLSVNGLYSPKFSWSDSDDDIETQVAIIKSYFVVQRAAERLNLIPKKSFKEEVISDIVGDLQSKVAVEREKYTYILNIKVTDKTPVFAQKLANTIAKSYQEFHAEQQAKRTTDTVKFIDEQLNAVRKKLQAAEYKFNMFLQDNQLISINRQSEDFLGRAKEIRSEIRRLQDDRNELEGLLIRLHQFIAVPSGSGHKLYSKSADREYQNSHATLMGLLLKRETLQDNYTPQHPDTMTIGKKIVETARKLVLLVQQQLSDMDREGIHLKKELKDVEWQTNSLMGKRVEFNQLKRKVALFNNMVDLLEKKNQEALISKADKPEEVSIIKPALLSARPVNPPKITTVGAMGVVIGMILGLVLAFIVETFDTSLGAIEDVEETIGTQVLGVIPHVDNRELQEILKGKHGDETRTFSRLQSANLISHFAPRSMMAESFRSLRTNIQFKDMEKKIKTIAVTSTTSNEGKTLVVANMAITMAQAGLKTLVVGSDLRRPTLAKVFGLEKSPGLTDFLLGNYPWRETIKTITDIVMGEMTMDEAMTTPGLDNLSVLTSGAIPPNPAELIDSWRLMDFIKEAKEEYDIILFDTPPVLSAADGAILGTKMDGALLLYRLGAVPRGLLKRSATQLKQIKCNIMGVIINGMRPEISPDFHGHRYYNYSYAYDEEVKNSEGLEPKKAFLFKRSKGDRDATKKQSSQRSGEKGFQEYDKQSNTLRSPLVVLALASLSMGILWQNGSVNPIKWLELENPIKKGEIFISTKNRLSKTAIDRKPIPASTNPGSAISPAKPGLEVKAPITQPPPVANKGANIQIPGIPKRLRSLAYSIHLGSFRTQDGAKNAMTIYRKKGLSPFGVKADLGEKGVWYRVFAGHFDEREQTERFSREHGLKKAYVMAVKVAEIEATGFIEKFPSNPYSIQLGSFRTFEGAKKAISTFRDKGLLPYFDRVDLGEKGTWFRVYMGHFKERKQAERFRQEHGLKRSFVKKIQ